MALLAAALVGGCGYDWGHAQRVGSCANCEIIVKVEGIFDSMSLPNAQSLTWQKEPDEPSSTSLLTNFNFRNDVEGWVADEGHRYQDAALATTGSSQCRPAQERTAYRFFATARMTSSFGTAGLGLEFFSDDQCGEKALAKYTTVSVVDVTSWKSLSAFAVSPPFTRSVRARMFTVAKLEEPRVEALFDNAILRAAPP